jgi:hypothetical protein
MKIRSLLLGSAALAGLSTAGYAADLGVVTSLDVCDELGLSGLTISSDDNCLVITGGVTFEYDWGNYQGLAPNDHGRIYASFVNQHNGNNYTIYDPIGSLDSNRGDVDAWLKFVATANTDFGPATATIKLVSNNINGTGNWNTAHKQVGVGEAWVGIGDTTMLMAGYKSSIFNAGDDTPLNYLGLFNAQSVNAGVGFVTNLADTGGDVIQVVSNLGNGLQVGGGLENLNGQFGTMTGVGVLSYAGDGITAHISAAVGSDNHTIAEAGGAPGWKIHAGFTGAWDPIKVVAAVSADDTGYWNALGSVAATFDMFTLAASGEATSAGEWGVGGSASAKVTDSVTLNLGGRYFHGVSTQNTHDTLNPYNVYQVEAGLSAAVTETITLTGAVGYTDSTIVGADPTPAAFYGNAGVAWAPGGGFTSSASVGADSLGGYKAVFKAAKTIK